MAHTRRLIGWKEPVSSAVIFDTASLHDWLVWTFLKVLAHRGAGGAEADRLTRVESRQHQPS